MKDSLINGNSFSVNSQFWRYLLSLKMSPLNLGDYLIGALIRSQDGQKIILVYPKESYSIEHIDVRKTIDSISRSQAPKYYQSDETPFPFFDIQQCVGLYAITVNDRQQKYTLLVALPEASVENCDFVMNFFEDGDLDYKEIQSMINTSEDHELFYVFYSASYAILGVAYRTNCRIPLIQISCDLMIDASLSTITRVSEITM